MSQDDEKIENIRKKIKDKHKEAEEMEREKRKKEEEEREYEELLKILLLKDSRLNESIGMQKRLHDIKDEDALDLEKEKKEKQKEQLQKIQNEKKTLEDWLKSRDNLEQEALISKLLLRIEDRKRKEDEIKKKISESLMQSRVSRIGQKGAEVRRIEGERQIKKSRMG